MEHSSENRITSFGRGGFVFDVVDQGPVGGDVVVLLHGFPQTGRCWDVVAPRLHALGYRTLVPDQRGYSVGARPRGRFAYRLSELVLDVVGLVEVAVPAGRKVHVVGHDWGATVAWALAAKRPDVVATVTALSVPHPLAFVRALFTSRQFFMSWYMFAFQVPGVPELVLRWIYRRARGRLVAGLAGGEHTEGGAARDVDFLATSGALTPALNWYRAMPFISPRAVGRVTVPALFVWSDKDPALGRRGAELTRRYVSGPYTFHVLPGVGHWIPEEAAGEVAELLRGHLAR